MPRLKGTGDASIMCAEVEPKRPKAREVARKLFTEAMLFVL